MSLKARIKRLEAAADWLRYEGRVLLAARQLEVFHWNERLEEGWERHFREKARAEAMARAREERRAQQAAEPPPKPAESKPRAMVEPYDDDASRMIEPPPKIETDPWAALTDVPPDKLVRPITWRYRGPDDWDDDDDRPAVLTEYDPLAADDDDDW